MTDLSAASAIEFIDATGLSLGVSPAAADGERLTAEIDVPDAARIRVFDAAGTLLIEFAKCEELASMLRDRFDKAT